MEIIRVVGEKILELQSKQDWIDRVPKDLPKKLLPETWIWVDANGSIFEVGADFTAAEERQSYPCKVYRLIPVRESIKTNP